MAPSAGGRVLRSTQGVCPVCLDDVPADVVADDATVRLVKKCPTDGETEQVLSRSPAYWADLDRYYFRVNAEDYRQRDFIVRMTEDCNLDCPICLARANTEATPDLDMDRVSELLSERRGAKIDLMAAEPTLREDLEDWVRTIKARGGIAALHTNGLKLADREYAQKLKDAGVDEVFLQFDGFDEAANKALRGRPLVKARLAAMKNLRELGLATSLIVVVGKDLNEAQVGEVLRFALKSENDHVREVFFLGLRLLGNARQTDRDGRPYDGAAVAAQTLMPDEILDRLVEQEPRVRRDDVRLFNKLYFAMLSTFQVKKCLYVQHYLLVRDERGGYRPISDYVDLPYLGVAAERYAKRFASHPRLARARLLTELAASIRPAGVKLAADLLRLERLFQTGMNLDAVPRRFLLLGFITACDPWNFDAQVAVNCGKGELSVDGGFVESGAVANVKREKRFEQSTAERGNRRFKRK